jgi:hypothetical protein
MSESTVPTIALRARVLRLILLAPNIVEAILDGRQPRTLELPSLLKPQPTDWGAQRKRLGFT